jgi:hypothetical protein
MTNQFFNYHYGDETLYFETCINGEGYYSRDNNTILGTIYDSNGKRLCTSRIDYKLLSPVSYQLIKKIFPDKA